MDGRYLTVQSTYSWLKFNEIYIYRSGMIHLTVVITMNVLAYFCSFSTALPSNKLRNPSWQMTSSGYYGDRADHWWHNLFDLNRYSYYGSYTPTPERWLQIDLLREYRDIVKVVLTARRHYGWELRKKMVRLGNVAAAKDGLHPQDTGNAQCGPMTVVHAYHPALAVECKSEPVSGRYLTVHGTGSSGVNLAELAIYRKGGRVPTMPWNVFL